MYLSANNLRAGYTVTHSSFIKSGLPEHAVIVEALSNGKAELDNGLFLYLVSLKRVETGETWVPVMDYSHRYLISSQGKVVSLLYHNTARERLLKVIRPDTYPVVSLCSGSGAKQMGLARLVAQHFLPPPADMRCVCAIHKDGNRLNISADNLQWADPTDVEDAFVRYHLHRHGERHGLSKLTAEEITRIRELSAAGISKTQIADEFEVSRPTISQIVNRISRRYA
jgi:DNA-binding CsgD family transcriptional regulator